MINIELKFDGTTVALAGNPFGKRTYEKQVSNKLGSIDDHVTIVFPNRIIYVTSSFIQGFFDYWLRTMSVEEIRDKVTIKTGNEKVTQYIWENIR